MYSSTNIKRFVEEFEKNFSLDIPFDEKNDLNRELYDVLFGFLKISKEIMDLEIFSNEYDLSLIKNNSTFLKNINLIEQSFFDCFGEDKNHLFAYTFFLLSSRLDYNHFHQKVAPIKIKIFIDFDIYFANYVKEKLNSYFLQKIEVHIINDNTTLDDDLKDTDIFITNVFLETFDFDQNFILCVSHYFSEENLIQVAQMISHVESNKKGTM